MSAILQELVEAGRQLVRDNLVTGADSNVSHLLAHPRFRFVRQDVTQHIAVEGASANANDNTGQSTAQVAVSVLRTATDIRHSFVGGVSRRHAEQWDEIVIDGDISAKDCLVKYRKKGRTLAVASIFRDLASLQAEVEMERAREIFRE